jgi:large conductance mechanosensitive channel
MQPPIKIKAPSWLSEFKAFIMRGSVVDLAVGIIIGAAFTGVVNSLVKDIFNPIIGLLIGGVDFSNVFIPLNGQHYNSLGDAQRAGAATLNVGLFINTIIQFVIVGFTIFWTVKGLSKLHLTAEEKKELPPPPRSEVLLEEIRDLLKERAAPQA